MLPTGLSKDTLESNCGIFICLGYRWAQNVSAASAKMLISRYFAQKKAPRELVTRGFRKAKQQFLEQVPGLRKRRTQGLLEVVKLCLTNS